MAERKSDSKTDRIWGLMESIRFCIFSSWTGTRIHARPMGAFVQRADGAVYFFTDVRAHKHEEIERFPDVCLAFSDPKRQAYATVYGTAELAADARKIRELWSIPTQAWWTGPDDPNLRLIKVTPNEGEYWDAPGNVVSGIMTAFAAATGTRPAVGEHDKAPL